MTDSFKTFRDPLLSVFQSLVAEVALKIDAKAATSMQGGRRGVRQSASSALLAYASDIAEKEYDTSRGLSAHESEMPRELTKAGMAKVCVEMSLRYLKAQVRGDAAALNQLKDEYVAGTCDTAWLSTLEEYARYLGSDGHRQAIPYITPAQAGSGIIEIASDARIAIASDWGTGAPPAVEVLKQIAGERPHAFIHLGDIYYSGTPKECQINFLDIVEKVLRADQPELPVYTLSGNHDMYCGGLGYYDLIRRLNTPAKRQTASFFCLRSSDEKWQLLAMDTGLHDDNPMGVTSAVTFLEDDEVEWHCQRINEFEGRTILLSHHQLFSAFSPIGQSNGEGGKSALNPQLLKAFGRMKAKKEIAAWFWGHEHTLSIYKPFGGLERGRCVGHGAVPVSVVDEIYKPLDGLLEIPALLDNCRLGTRGGVYNHGYAVIALAGATCHASYFQSALDGRSLVFQETF